MKNALLLVLVAGSLGASAAYTPDKRAVAAYAKASATGADATVNPHSGDAASVSAGAALFQKRCVQCHGVGAQGDGIVAASLTPLPGNLADPVRWAFTPVGVKQWIVLNGVAGTGMVPTGISVDDSWLILAYLEATYH